VAGLDRYLPAGFGRLHPRHATPHVALLVTAALSSIMVLLSFPGGSVQDAYLFLAGFTLVVYFVPYLYLFAALFRLSARGEAPPGVVPVPGGRAGAVVVSVVGFATTALAIAFALIPAADVAHPALFHLRLLASCLLIAAIGWLFYHSGRRRRGGGK
jgi:amino acid transporter